MQIVVIITVVWIPLLIFRRDKIIESTPLVDSSVRISLIEYLEGIGPVKAQLKEKKI